MHRSLCALVFLAAASIAFADEPITGCVASGNQQPVCKFQNPEDLVPLPGGAALLVSEYGDLQGGRPGGLALFVLETDERRDLFRGGDAKAGPTEGWGDPACPGPPPPDFSPHGIDLARRSDGALALAAVQHGGRESIELFELSGSDSNWSLAWRGCWIAPDDAWLNEVILLADGSLMASHMMPRSAGERAFENGAPGWVLHWTPDGGFSKVAGSEVLLANGLELSDDEKTLYLNSSVDGLRRIDLAKGKVTGHAEIGALDNSTWAPDGKLLVAHLLPESNESFAICGARKQRVCPIPFRIVAVDPDTLETSVRFDSVGSPMGAGTVGLQVGDELFVGSFSGDRILRVDLSEKPPSL